MNYHPDFSPGELFAEHVRFAERFEKPLRGAWPAHDNDLDPDRRLRIGFVSGDLNQHPVGIFMESVLAHLGQRDVGIFLYPTHYRADALTARLRSMGFSWCSLVGLSDDMAAKRIREDGVDILVDLSGHSAHNRLMVFARKPAPVQVTWLGYFATTGLKAMDYVLCDPWILPADESGYFVERPWQLPHRYLCFTPPQENIPIAPPPSLSNEFVTFGCFNNLAKMNDAVVALWARLLLQIPDSRLFLKAKPFVDPNIQRMIRERFFTHGITGGRLVLEGGSPRDQYLAAYNRIDIALDPFPYAGGTTSVESLWMGVPVLTRKGDRFVSHMGESILHNIGFSDWIAQNDDDYVKRAVAFAHDLPALTEIRRTLRDRVLASPLCNVEDFCDNLGAAFRGMWQEYCKQKNAAADLAKSTG